MKVLKNIRRKKQGTMRIGIGSKKHLNYSTVSNGSGNTEDENSLDMIEPFSPLKPQDIGINSNMTDWEDFEKPPETTPEPKLSLFHDNSQPLVIRKNSGNKPPRPPQTMSYEHPSTKRVPADPIAPLGTVVNDGDNEWDSVSHISVISNHSSTTGKSPAQSPSRNNIPSNDGVEEVKAGTVADAIRKFSPSKTVGAAVVSPGSEENNKADGTAPSSSGEAEDGGMAHRILKRFDDSESNSKISHIFEDDQESHYSSGIKPSSTNNVVVLHTTGTSPLYSEKIPMPVTVSPDTSTAKDEKHEEVQTVYSEKIPVPASMSPETSPAKLVPAGNDLTPAFEAIAREETSQQQQQQAGGEGLPEEPPTTAGKNRSIPTFEMPEPPPTDLSGTIAAPSFDGSTATEFTNNTTSNKSGSAKSNGYTAGDDDDITTKDSDQTSIFSTITGANTKIHEKLNEIEVTMGFSCVKMREIKPPEMPTAPHCNSVFSSTQTLSENLRDSLQTIKKELSGAVSGLSSASSTVVKKAQKESRSFFRTEKLNASVDTNVEEEAPEDLEPIPEESIDTAESVCTDDRRYDQRSPTHASF